MSFKCDHCDKTFKRQQAMFSHRKTHTNIPCPGCDKVCKTRLQWINHKYNCLKSTACEICGMTFSTVNNLRRHNQTVHVDKEKTEVLHCSKCLYSTYSQVYLKQHTYVEHNPKQQKENKPEKAIFDRPQVVRTEAYMKIYQCTECSREIASSQLFRHYK